MLKRRLQRMTVTTMINTYQIRIRTQPQGMTLICIYRLRCVRSWQSWASSAWALIERLKWLSAIFTESITYLGMVLDTPQTPRTTLLVPRYSTPLARTLNLLKYFPKWANSISQGKMYRSRVIILRHSIHCRRKDGLMTMWTMRWAWILQHLYEWRVLSRWVQGSNYASMMNFDKRRVIWMRLVENYWVVRDSS